jgi:hypothetical protein
VPGVHERDLATHSSPADFVYYYRLLAGWHLAPAVVEVTDEVLRTELHPTLRQWWEAGQSGTDLAAMRVLLRTRIDELHSHGICHRDLHIDNVVLRDGLPLFIDPDFAIASDPHAPCFDLYGPDASGVPAPHAHKAQGGAAAQGVWWHAPVLHRTFGHTLGPIPQAEPI